MTDPQQFMRRAVAIHLRPSACCAGARAARSAPWSSHATAISWPRGFTGVISIWKRPRTAHAEQDGDPRSLSQARSFQPARAASFTRAASPVPCASALYTGRAIDRVYFANTRGDAAVIGFDDDHIYRESTLPISRTDHFPSSICLSTRRAACSRNGWLNRIRFLTESGDDNRDVGGIEGHRGIAAPYPRGHHEKIPRLPRQ